MFIFQLFIVPSSNIIYNRGEEACSTKGRSCRINVAHQTEPIYRPHILGGIIMAGDMEESDFFKQVIKNLCKINNISPRKISFETIENIVVLSMKNHLKDGVDLECFHI